MMEVIFTVEIKNFHIASGEQRDPSRGCLRHSYAVLFQ
jgi:hypothetical protein